MTTRTSAPNAPAPPLPLTVRARALNHAQLSIEEHLCHTRGRLRTLRAMLYDQLDAVTDADVTESSIELLEECLLDVSHMLQAPPAVLGWSPEDEGGAR